MPEEEEERPASSWVLLGALAIVVVLVPLMGVASTIGEKFQAKQVSMVAAAIVFNPGAFTHYAHALADALAAYDGVVVEVHLSNPAAREAWRRTSVIAPVATGTIAGFGGTGYRLAVQAALALLEDSAP